MADLRPRALRLRLAGAVLAPVAATIALVPLRPHILNTNLALALVLVVLAAAAVGGRACGVTSALSAALAYDYFLTVPYSSFTIERGDDIETTVLLRGDHRWPDRRHRSLPLGRALRPLQRDRPDRSLVGATGTAPAQPRGNRQLNHALHLAAVTQVRNDTPGRAYYLRKEAEGKTRKEALRALKRRISDAVYRRLVADARRRG